jgi:hypothetical protein
VLSRPVSASQRLYIGHPAPLSARGRRSLEPERVHIRLAADPAERQENEPMPHRCQSIVKYALLLALAGSCLTATPLAQVPKVSLPAATLAGAARFLLPVFFLFLLLQREIAAGLTSGAVKG